MAENPSVQNRVLFSVAFPAYDGMIENGISNLEFKCFHDASLFYKVMAFPLALVKLVMVEIAFQSLHFLLCFLLLLMAEDFLMPNTA